MPSIHGSTAQNTAIADRDRGYLTTFSALVLKGRQAHLFHVGDSRVWRVCGTNLELLTADHRVAVSESENYLGRALGLMPSAEIDYLALEVAPGDIFVLTTDGVHGHVAQREMATRIAGTADLQRAADDIAGLAFSRGSTDNLTIQIARVDIAPPGDTAGAPDDLDTLPPAGLPQVPSEFDGYQIVRQIHASNRSHIFLAADPETGIRVTIKFPSIDLRDNRDYLRRFAMEEWIARRISSPHVIKSVPAPDARNCLYVVNEYVEGQTLRQWMADNPTPELETVRDIVEQIAAGVRAFHRKDMLHQDLRPENIMIDRNGTAKIIDLGSVRVAGFLEAMPGIDGEEILGTVQYSAPECLLGHGGTEQSDLFSLGVIAYEMLTGRLPYSDKLARARTVRAQARLSFIAARTVNPRVPEWVDYALRKAVHLDPHRRYEAMSEFTTDLRRASPAFRPDGQLPLVERDPLLFWKTLSALLALAVFFLAFELLKTH